MHENLDKSEFNLEKTWTKCFPNDWEPCQTYWNQKLNYILELFVIIIMYDMLVRKYIQQSTL